MRAQEIWAEFWTVEWISPIHNGIWIRMSIPSLKLILWVLHADIYKAKEPSTIILNHRSVRGNEVSVIFWKDAALTTMINSLKILNFGV